MLGYQTAQGQSIDSTLIADGVSYQFIAGFANQITTLNAGSYIPTGIWDLNLFASLDSVPTTGNVSIIWRLFGVTGISETQISGNSSPYIISAIYPNIGQSAMTLAVGQTGLSMYESLVIKLYASNTDSVGHTAYTYYEGTSEYTHIHTSFGDYTPQNILSITNTWTGYNTYAGGLQSTQTISGHLYTTSITGNGINSVNDLSCSAGSTIALNSAQYLIQDPSGNNIQVRCGYNPSPQILMNNADAISKIELTASSAPQLTVTNSAGHSTLMSNSLEFSQNSTLSCSIGTLSITAPTLSGVPLSTTAAVGTNTTQIATTAFVQGYIPATINTTSDNTAGTYYIPFSKTAAQTSTALFLDDTTTALTYNPSTSVLTATTFSGNASTATNSIGVSTTLSVAATTFYPTFVANNTTTTNQAESVATALSFIPSTGILSATGITTTGQGSFANVLVTSGNTWTGGNITVASGLTLTTGTLTLGTATNSWVQSTGALTASGLITATGLSSTARNTGWSSGSYWLNVVGVTPITTIKATLTTILYTGGTFVGDTTQFTSSVSTGIWTVLTAGSYKINITIAMSGNAALITTFLFGLYAGATPVNVITTGVAANGGTQTYSFISNLVTGTNYTTRYTASTWGGVAGTLLGSLSINKLM